MGAITAPPAIGAHQRGIDLIDRFLQPESKFVHFMTDAELAGMREVRTLLVAAKQEKEYTPPDLEHSSSHVSDFVKQEFGGQRRMSLRKVGDSIRMRLSFADTRRITSSKESFLDENTYVPGEFLALDRRGRERVRDMLDCENLKLWSFDVQELATATKGNPLLFAGWAILGAPHAQKAMARCLDVEPPAWVHGLTQTDVFEFLETFHISPKVLCNFLRAVEAEYSKENPYHNNVHGADVVQTTYSLLRMGGVKYSGGTLDTFSLLVAAACHDMGHPGLNNLYQIHTKSDLAIIYNDQAVLENMHASATFRLLNNSLPEANLDITSGLNCSQYEAFRSIVVDSILYTDMSRHFKQVGELQSLVTHAGTGEPSKYVTDKNRSISQALLYFLHMADISNSAKPAPLAQRWAERVLAEFFAQGDREKGEGLPVSPLCDRDRVDLGDSQVGFVRFVILPSFLLLAELIPAVGEEVVPILRENLAYWEELKEREEKEKAAG